MIALTTDVALLARLHAQCFSEYWSAASFEALLANQGCFAFADEAELGFIVVQVVADQSEVLSLGVVPAARRRGIASCLIGTAVNCTLERGSMCMFLEVDCANYAAIALYKRNGFAEAGRRPGYYRHRDGSASDALILRVEILAPRVGNAVQLG